MRALPLFHRIAGTPVIVLGQGPAAEAKRRLVERAGGLVVGEESDAARLAFVAEDAPEAAAARLKARGLLVNVTDRPDLCDFTVPSLLDRDPLLIAVGTDGASAGLAKHVRLRLDALLPSSLGALAHALSGARDAIRQHWPHVDDRRRALDAALGEGGPLDPLTEGAAERIARWIAAPAAPEPNETIEFVITSDDPDDLTLRQVRWLGRADAVLHDPAIALAILDRARADALRIELPHQGELPAGLVLILKSSPSLSRGGGSPKD